MKVTEEMIEAGLEALANAKQAGASCTLSQVEMKRMPDQILEARVSRLLAGRLGHQLGFLAEHHEVLWRDKQAAQADETATEFIANVIVMKPDDYNLLCRLLRLMRREIWNHDPR